MAAIPVPAPGVSNLVFFVRDLDSTEAFYRDILGFEVNRIPGHDGSFLLAETQEGGPTLVFLPGDEPCGRTPVVVFGLEGGIENVVEALALHNVEIVVPVSGTPDGGLSVDFADPDGHLLSFYQPQGAPRRLDS